MHTRRYGVWREVCSNTLCMVAIRIAAVIDGVLKLTLAAFFAHVSQFAATFRPPTTGLAVEYSDYGHLARYSIVTSTIS